MAMKGMMIKQRGRLKMSHKRDATSAQFQWAVNSLLLDIAVWGLCHDVNICATSGLNVYGFPNPHGVF